MPDMQMVTISNSEICWQLDRFIQGVRSAPFNYYTFYFVEGPMAGPKCVILHERREQSQIITKRRKKGTHRGFIIARGGTDTLSGDLGEMLATRELLVDSVMIVMPTSVEIGSSERAEMPGLPGVAITGTSG
jgi:hypothetical protein